MSSLVIHESPLQVLPSLAVVLGLNEAIVVQQVHYWIEHNARCQSQKHFHDGRWWTFNTIEEWNQQFPFWSEGTIKRTFKKLENAGILLKGNFNHSPFDKTKWTTIDYEALERYNIRLDQIDQIHDQDQSEQTDRLDPSDPVRLDQIAPMREISVLPSLSETISSENTEISLSKPLSEPPEQPEGDGNNFFEQPKQPVDSEELINFVISQIGERARHPRAYAKTAIQNDREYWQGEFEQSKQPAIEETPQTMPLIAEPFGSRQEAPPIEVVNDRAETLARARSLKILSKFPALANFAQQRLKQMIDEYLISPEELGGYLRPETSGAPG